MDKFLNRYKLPYSRRNRNLNRYIASKEIELLIKKTSTKKSSGSDGFTGDSTTI